MSGAMPLVRALPWNEAEGRTGGHSPKTFYLGFRRGTAPPHIRRRSRSERRASFASVKSPPVHNVANLRSWRPMASDAIFGVAMVSLTHSQKTKSRLTSRSCRTGSRFWSD